MQPSSGDKPGSGAHEKIDDTQDLIESAIDAVVEKIAATAGPED